MNRARQKSGPLTREELLAVWARSAVDTRTYAEPMIAQGEGNGLEAYTQGFAQLARVSQAIDTTTQACYILPHSAQSAPPASGAQKSRVTLTFSRTGGTQVPVVLGAGSVFVEEETTDWGSPSGVTVRTGRKYTLASTLVFHPGEAGPLDVEAVAELPGYGYNNPLPGTIRAMQLLGEDFSNDNAVITVTSVRALMALRTTPDVLVPTQIGQYVTITNGTNLGRIGRIVSYRPPLVGIDGGAVELEGVHSVLSRTVTGSLSQGETLSLRNGLDVEVGIGNVVGARTGADSVLRVTYTLQSGIPAPAGGSLVGVAGGTVSVDSVAFDGTWSAQSPTSWRTTRWDADLGLSCTNAASPSGGTAPLLDILGRERNVDRAPGEPDDSYRLRVADVGDVVCPNALRRAANRVLAPFGYSGCLREAGLSKLRGFFFDAGSSSDAVQVPDNNFAYDMDPELRPEDRWRVWLSFQEMRGFFLMGIPRICDGDFGLFYDGASTDNFALQNAYDTISQTARAAYDGYSPVAAYANRTVLQELDARRAGGVSYDIYPEEGNCT